MAAGQEISQHIPYLRRFARALTGSQAQGDACVAAALEAIMKNPESFRAGPNARIALYRVFVETWEARAGGLETPSENLTPDERGARERLGALSMRPRVAFLLSALEGFAPADIAAILGAPREEAEHLLETAAREIADQLRTDVLVIEDEPLNSVIA
jgi:DNA-directed RNA polymerase specialized sigma24 family protein